MKIDESTVAIAYHHFAEKGDVMVTFYKKEGKIAGNGRLRIYLSDNPDAFSGDDKKMWFEMRDPADTIPEAMEKLKDLLEKARKSIGPLLGGLTTEGPAVLLRGNDESTDDFMKRLHELPFVHIKEVKP